MARLLGIVLMLAGAVCLAKTETFGEFMLCQKNALNACSKSNPVFQDFTSAEQISNFFQDKDNKYCTEKEAFSKLMTCFYDAQKSCLDAEYKDVLSTAEAQNSALDYYCTRIMNNSENFNFQCIMNAAAEMGKCVKEHNSGSVEFTVNTTIAEYKAQQCSLMEITEKCYEDHLTGCPSTKDTLMEIMMKVKPEACSGTTIFYNSILIFFSLYLFKFFM